MIIITIVFFFFYNSIVLELIRIEQTSNPFLVCDPSLAEVLNIYAKASNLSQPWHLCFDLVKSFMLPLYKQKLFQPVCVCVRTWSPDRNSQRPRRVQMASPLVMSHHTHFKKEICDEEEEKTSSASQLWAGLSCALIGCWPHPSSNQNA